MLIDSLKENFCNARISMNKKYSMPFHDSFPCIYRGEVQVVYNPPVLPPFGIGHPRRVLLRPLQALQLRARGDEQAQVSLLRCICSLPS